MYPNRNLPSEEPTPRPRQVDIKLERERGGCLTLWLVVSFGFTILAGIVLFGALNTIADTTSGRSLRPEATISILLLSILFIATLACLVGIGNWKRWAVYGMGVVSFASLAIETLFARPDATDCIAPFVQIGILYFLVKDRWDDFR